MHVGTLTRLLFVSLPFAAISCVAEDGVLSMDDELIGGQIAKPGMFPSTFQIEGNCTVTKVGENLILSAAHCVREEDGSISPNFQRGSFLDVRLRSPAVDGGVERTVTLTIKNTEIHPRIAYYCRTTGCRGAASAERRDAPDLAVIEVNGGLEGVPAAVVDIAPTKPGDQVTLLGYGCKTNVTTDDSDGLLRYRDTTLAPVDVTIHEGGLKADEREGLISIAANNVFTKGPGSSPQFVGGTFGGLCPGDSGAALYRKGTNVVVGVNASYTFRPGGGWIPVTNWHVRVDRESRWGTASWLESKGVRLSGKCVGCVPTRYDVSADRSGIDGGKGETGVYDGGTYDGGRGDGGRDSGVAGDAGKSDASDAGK